MMHLIFPGTLLINASACSSPDMDGAERVDIKSCVTCHDSSVKALRRVTQSSMVNGNDICFLQRAAYCSGKRRNGVQLR